MKTKKKVTKFNKMTASEKRVAVAKDVIAGLKAKRITAKPGTYVSAYISTKDRHNILDKYDSDEDHTEELQSILKKVNKCEVCAKGAIFIEGVRRFNECKLDLEGVTDLVYGDKPDCFSDYIRDIFSLDQLNLIEDVFEKNINIYDQDTEIDRIMNINDAEKRMIAIMQNIIKNKGRFVVE